MATLPLRNSCAKKRQLEDPAPLYAAKHGAKSQPFATAANCYSVSNQCKVPESYPNWNMRGSRDQSNSCAAGEISLYRTLDKCWNLYDDVPIYCAK